ncbi:hypothetical protein TH63_13530 [Rufibacter radiotolerans]|uniref:Uncharacterized protein n=1 Tax=Rufibacter radiotolerans TaxID=1379910 RepID=A0A0H4VM64_9BACT|nr:hypothetical protein TH63_13530 [Rufibacter radiotolerans]
MVAQVLKENPDLKTFTVNNKPLTKDKPWNSISFFTEATFCKLSAKAIDQLKVRIDDLGIHKPTETLSENQQPARLAHPKAYEPWTEKETEYLAKALSYTNDLQVLSSCFQRTESSLSSMGKKLIYEGKAAIDPEAQALNNI